MTADDAAPAPAGVVPPDAVLATGVHGADPVDVAVQFGVALRTAHDLSVCPELAGPSIEGLLARAVRRVEGNELTEVDEGPYRGRTPEDLLAVVTELFASIDDVAAVAIHGNPTLDDVWVTPTGGVVLSGWAGGSPGDRHRDLAVGAGSLIRFHGPEVVAPFLDSYGLDAIDLRRLDAHQLLAHLLGDGS